MLPQNPRNPLWSPIFEILGIFENFPPAGGGGPRGGKNFPIFPPRENRDFWPFFGKNRGTGQGPSGGDPPENAEKCISAVPTGRVIKYPKKCALFAPPGARGARGDTPGARGAPVCRRTTSADYPDAVKHRAQDVMVAQHDEKKFRDEKKNFFFSAGAQ